jgi:hypothetical protein
VNTHRTPAPASEPQTTYRNGSKPSHSVPPTAAPISPYQTQKFYNPLQNTTKNTHTKTQTTAHRPPIKTIPQWHNNRPQQGRQTIQYQPKKYCGQPLRAHPHTPLKHSTTALLLQC